MPNFIITNSIPVYDSIEIKVANIDGAKCKTVKKFLAVISKELAFPAYFGKNLDAFDEMINDLSWLLEEAVIIAITNFENLLENDETEDGDAKGLILSLLDQAADEQKNTKDGTPIRIIIEKTLEIESYLEENGLEFMKN